MKKRLCALLLALTTVLTVMLSLTSCGNDGVEVPEEMQIVRESKADGYIFFGPEGWKVANQGEVAATYLSAFNRVSITFTKADMPTVGTAAEGTDAHKVAFDAYMKKTSESFPYELSGEMSGKKINFGSSKGAADLAYEYIYTYKADGEDVACRQILVVRGEDFFILTYTAFGSPTDENSSYRIYLPKVNLVIKNFLFTKKGNAPEADKPTYEKDGDGYILVSDKALSGFKLYIPEDYEVVDNSGIVSAKISGGANIIISKATETGQSVLNYVLNRRQDVLEVADKDSLVDIKVSVPEEIKQTSESLKGWPLEIWPEYDPNMKFGNLPSGTIAAYEYKFSHGGNDYHSFQILGVTSGLFQSGYVFTYTALESEYDDHIEEVMKIISKVEF
ncbi:MAG: hypothetical protein IJE25_06750 [Clostridia bacterium]|nr:hypothetical protein [Clostridia bacterium]